jgi:hypothetical protein
MTAVTVRSGTNQAAGGSGQRSSDTSNLGRLRRVRVVLTVSALLFGLAGVWTVQNRSDGAHDATSHSGLLTAQVEQLYHKLSDADATAATAYLHTGLEPANLRQQYVTDLSQATDALTKATAVAAGASDSSADLNTISQNLPTYVGEIESARDNNRQGFPLGARYLNLASQLMQKTILPAAQHLNRTESDNLAAAESKSTALPWLEIGVGVLFLLALLLVQRSETRRTHRLLNPGLVAATIGVALSALWLVGAFLVEDSQVGRAQTDGSNQVGTLSQAQIASLRARSDEMLTLVGRGSAPDKEAAYKNADEPTLASLLEAANAEATDGFSTAQAAKAVTDETAWHKAHDQLRALDDANDYPGALQSAALSDKAKDGSPSADADFKALQADLDAAIGHAQSSFQTHSKSAAGDLFGAEPGMAVLGLLIAAGIVMGLGRRISEYQ